MITSDADDTEACAPSVRRPSGLEMETGRDRLCPVRAGLAARGGPCIRWLPCLVDAWWTRTTQRLVRLRCVVPPGLQGPALSGPRRNSGTWKTTHGSTHHLDTKKADAREGIRSEV